MSTEHKHTERNRRANKRVGAGTMVSQFAKLVNEILEHQIANRGTSSEFYRCYTYNTGKFPPWVAKAKRLLDSL